MNKQLIIKNSAGKNIGTIDLIDFKIFIKNGLKPVLVIDNEEIVKKIFNKEVSNEFLLFLYNDLMLSIGEIACLYEVCYSNINKKFKKISNWKPNKNGRRNRAYGLQQTKETKDKISNSLKGHKPVIYKRTPEIREKISKSLKEYFKKHPQNPEPHKKNWRNGIYDKVDFHRGISGHFFSIKNNKEYNFRSLLELYYMLQLEKQEDVKEYLYEPFHILMDNGSSYLPDVLFNNNLIELKSKKYINCLDEKTKMNFLYKIEQAKKYCLLHNLNYKVIYDEDIGFETKKMKHFIKDNPNIVEKYKIVFNKPERMVIK